MAALGTRRLQAHPDVGEGPERPPGNVVTAGGARLHFVEQGEGAPILLVHGFGGSTFGWRHVMPLLAAGHRVVAVDVPGFGFSDRSPSLVLSQGRQAERMVSLLDHLGIARAVVIGHSMGGAIAQRLAAAFPARVERLVLVAAVDASVRPAWRARGAWSRRAGVAAMSAGLMMPPLVAWTSRKSLERMVWDRRFVTDDVVRGYVRPLLLPGTAASLSRMAADTADETLADLARISAPTLVLSGEADAVVPPEVGAAIAAKIGGARHLIIPRAGHLLAEERPDAVVEEVLAFLHEPLGAAP